MNDGALWEVDVMWRDYSADVSPGNSLQCVMSERWLPDQARDCSACL